LRESRVPRSPELRFKNEYVYIGTRMILAVSLYRKLPKRWRIGIVGFEGSRGRTFDAALGRDLPGWEEILLDAVVSARGI